MGGRAPPWQGPHEAAQLTDHGDSHHIAPVTSCNTSPVTLAEPDMGFPTDGLNNCGLCVELQVQVATDLCRVVGGPGSFDQDASGRGMAGFGHRALSALLAGRLFSGDTAAVHCTPRRAWRASTTGDNRQVLTCSWSSWSSRWSWSAWSAAQIPPVELLNLISCCRIAFL